MRILFLLPVPAATTQVYHGFHQGVGSLSAVLKRAGHQTALWSGATVEARSLLTMMASFEPDLVAVSVTTNQMRLAVQWTRIVAEHRPAPILFGGVHATVQPADCLSLPNVIGAAIGEGETQIVEVADRLAAGDDVRGTPGLAVLAEGAVVINPGPPFVDLDSLPPADRELFDYQAILDRNRTNVGVEMLASRGCPFPCTYCANHALNRAQHGRGPVVRWRSVDHVLDEIMRIRARYHGVELIGFHDDIFGLDRQWLEQWAERYPARVGLPYWANARVGVLDPERVRLLAASGCVRLHFGIETGDEDLRRDVLRRPMTNDQIIETFAMVRRAGMKTCAFFMMGLPYEDQASIERTISLARTIRPNWSVVSLFYPYPGTDLHERCRQEGLLLEEDSDSYYDPVSVIRHPWIETATLLEYYRDFIPRVYGKRPRHRRPAGRPAENGQV